jgi:hypothetical protein
MKKHPRKTRNQILITPTRYTAIVVVAILTFLLFGHGLCAQTPTPPPTLWPTKPPFKPAIDAFTKVLTQAGWDKKLRKELTASCDSAKKAVARVANMKIADPAVIIIFYEGKAMAAPSPTLTPAAEPMADPKLAEVLPVDPRQNELVHVFVLPPLNENDKTTTYEYKDYLMCCYQYWRQ